MLNPSDKKQRNTLIELAWLLISLYVLLWVTGARPFESLQQALRWNAAMEKKKNEPWDEKIEGEDEGQPAPKLRRDVP